MGEEAGNEDLRRVEKMGSFVWRKERVKGGAEEPEEDADKERGSHAGN